MGIIGKCASKWLLLRHQKPEGFPSLDHLPWTWDGGFLASVQRILPLDTITGSFDLIYMDGSGRGNRACVKVIVTVHLS